MRILNPNRLARVPMIAIVEHWTAGGHKANAIDKRSYHVITEGDGAVVYGVDIALNSGGTKSGYAAHTRNANTNRIGHSMAGMMGAIESPWNPGSAPLTKKQWDTHVLAAADLCEFYRIAVARDKLLFHAEVQSTLGITQAGKWDVVRLPFDESVRGAHAIGDKFRDEVLAALRGSGGADTDASPEPIPANIEGAVAIVTAASLNFRRGPAASAEITGALPAGTLILVIEAAGDWLKVRTPAGYVGWVHGGFVKLVDTAPLPRPTAPDPLHTSIAELRARLDQLDADLPTDREALAAAIFAARKLLSDF